MNSMNWKHPLVVAMGIATLALAGCNRAPADEHAHGEEHGEHAHDEHEHEDDHHGHVTLSPEALAANRVEVRHAGPGLIRTEIDLPGEIVLDADRVAHIVPRFPGIVQRVNKTLGDTVSAGDVLAVVQSNVSAAPYDVVSMVNGTIIEKHVALGEFVRDDADIFVVADLSTVWVNVSIYARFLADVKRGQSVRIEAPGVGAVTRGAIDYVGPIVGESTRTGVARVVLRNPERAWQPGLFVTAHIAVAEASVPVAVPDEAVQAIEGESVVFVQHDDGFEPRRVVVGRRGGEWIEIVEGLTAGESYVAAGSFIFKAELGKSEAGHDH